MRFKPGDKVWIDYRVSVIMPAGVYAGVLIRSLEIGEVDGLNPPTNGWWSIEIHDGWIDKGFGHERILRPRGDPPPQQEPKREATGDWDLCPWRPERMTEDVA